MDMGNMQDAGSSSIAIARRDLLLEYKPGNGEEGWYLVSIDLHNGKLVIHYETSAQKGDEELDLAEFKTAENLYAKFRRPSTQLTDKECEKVMPLWPVLVAYPPPPHYIPDTPCRYGYFDARIEEISRVEHINAGGIQNRVYTFKIIWLAGPEVGQTATVQRESIYLLGFRGLEKHYVLREAAKLVNAGKKYAKSTHITPSMAMASVSVPAMTNVSRKSFSNDLVRQNVGISIITDENGYIVCSTQRSSLLEYKPSNGDDGWYTVSISLHDGKLRVNYERLAEERADEFELADLRSADDLYLKFRVPSTQLKDEECWKVTPMWFVMVSYLPPGDHGGLLNEAALLPDSRLYRYYDACIEKVSQSNHITMHGQEKCTCTFEITWLGGPNIWQRANVYCENIYLPGFGNIGEHPVLKQATKFFESREYIKPHGIHKDASDIGFTSSSSFLSTNVLHGETNVLKNNIEDHLVRSSHKTEGSRIVIAEDENGFIVCRTQKEK